ncbi:MAG: tetratricopeptide repeat protein [Flavobacteriales bacterium]|nr:tetratricopeptide repeat protein [Flavobacteriales bacterium]
MNRACRLVLLSFLLSLSLSGFSQKNDIQTMYALARQAKDNGENKKAIGYFEELLKSTNSDSYYNELYSLYLLESDFNSVDKLVKKRIRKYPKRADLLVDKGNLLEIKKLPKEAEKIYNKAINEIGKDDRQTRLVANQFNKYKRYDYVEQAYLKARRSLRNERLYQFELANAYAKQGKTDEMVEEYLTILGGNRSYLQSIQNILQRVINPDPNGTQRERLKDILLRRIQKSPNQEVFSELLVWLFIQDKNFNGAFVQAKALDRKGGEEGKRLYNLGNLCLSNEEYQVAEKSYRYVIGLGEETPYFLRAKMQLVASLKAKIVNGNDYTAEDLQKLKLAYHKTINDLGKSSYTSPMLRGLAELNAYYLDSISPAIEILDEVINMNGLKNSEKAKTKIELADLYLLNDEVWEASLLYSQVEKEFKYDRIGEIAKYKNAKIAFYTGDFYWAQAQLDVLKGSTSKLISNDAMDLSLLITDNVGRDSIIEPLQMFAVADLLIFKKNYADANVVLDSIPKYFPFTTLIDDILFTKYEMAYQQKEYELAAKNLRTLIADYAEDLLGDDALFSLAKLEEEKFQNKEKAMELYKALLTTYPSSLFVVEARKRFRNLRGDKLEEEIN